MPRVASTTIAKVLLTGGAQATADGPVGYENGRWFLRFDSIYIDTGAGYVTLSWCGKEVARFEGPLANQTFRLAGLEGRTRIDIVD